MYEQELQFQTGAAGSGPRPAARPRHGNPMEWLARVWRPAATVAAVAAALWLGWHVVNGSHGLSMWQQNRALERDLGKDIQSLREENARLREHVDRLQKNDPAMIVHVARARLRYLKPNEVLVPTQDKPQTAAQPAGAGK